MEPQGGPPGLTCAPSRLVDMVLKRLLHGVVICCVLIVHFCEQGIVSVMTEARGTQDTEHKHKLPHLAAHQFQQVAQGSNKDGNGNNDDKAMKGGCTSQGVMKVQLQVARVLQHLSVHLHRQTAWGTGLHRQWAAVAVQNSGCHCLEGINGGNDMGFTWEGTTREAPGAGSVGGSIASSGGWVV